MVFAIIETTCAAPISTQQKGAILSANPREQLHALMQKISDRNGVAHVDQNGVEGLGQSFMCKNITLTCHKTTICAHPSLSEVPLAASIDVYLTIPPIVDFQSPMKN